MSGDSETGGGTSVHWKVRGSRADDLFTDNDRANLPGGPHQQRGRDLDGKIGAQFTVSLRVPDGVDPNTYLGQVRDGMRSVGRRIEFEVTIQDDESQIRVSWR